MTFVKRVVRTIFVLVFLIAVAQYTRAEGVTPAADDYPWWRGTSSDGHSASTNPPVQWSNRRNVIWRVEVPGLGHSTPVVWGDRIFLTTADEREQTQWLVCYDRDSGKRRWAKQLHRGDFVQRHQKNSHASPTPVCDGKNIYTVFAVQNALWLSALDLDGKPVYQQKIASFNSEHGYGSSPVLYNHTLIINCDNDGLGSLVAVDRATGRQVWRTQRYEDSTYGTPILGRVAGRDQILLCGAGMVNGYDPETGRPLWWCRGTAKVTANTVAFENDLVFASGGYPEKELMCIRADGTGDVSDSHVMWRTSRNVTYVPSPLAHEGRLYVVNDGGFASCIEQASGEVIWTQRLGGRFSASPVLANGLIYAADEQGKTFVFKAGRDYELVATNDLGEGHFASPVILGDRMYLRTNKALYCIGEKR